MQTDTAQKILNHIKQKGEASGNDLAIFLNLSDRGVRKQLSNLLKRGIITKIGKPPRVFYLLNNSKIKKDADKGKIDNQDKKIINGRYLIKKPSDWTDFLIISLVYSHNNQVKLITMGTKDQGLVCSPLERESYFSHRVEPPQKLQKEVVRFLIHVILQTDDSAGVLGVSA